MGATIFCERSEQKRDWSIAELSHFVLCVLRYFRQFVIEKKFPPVFNFFLSTQLFPGGICLHRSMEWTPLPVSATTSLLYHIAVGYMQVESLQQRRSKICNESKQIEVVEFGKLKLQII